MPRLTECIPAHSREPAGRCAGNEDEAAALLEFRFGAGAAELGEAAVGAAAEKRLLDVGAGAFDGSGGGSGLSVDPPIGQFPATPPAQGGGIPADQDPDRDLKQFVGFVVDDVQDSWARLFAEAGRRYEPTKLVLFTQAGPQDGHG